MAELNSRIKPKKSSVAGEVPLASDLEVAELAVNTADGKLFVKHTDDSIKEISGGGGGGGSGIEEAPEDGTPYVRQDADWVSAPTGGGGVATLPTVPGTFIDSDSTAATSQVLTAPSHDTGDLLVAVIMSRSTNGGLTPPPGFALYGTYLSDVTFSGGSQTLSVFYKTATASEPASYTWTQVNSVRICGLIAAVSAGSSISGVTESYGNGTVATIAANAGVLNLTAATWVYASPDEAEVYSQSGTGVTEITDSPVDEARISGGYTTASTTVTSYHLLDTLERDPNHGIINIAITAELSISDNSDVDTVTTPPADGQVLTWVDANNQWEPANAPDGGGAVESVNGQVGAVSLDLEDLGNVSDGTINWDVLTGADNVDGMVSGTAYTNTQLRVHPVSKEGDQKSSLRAWIATLTFPTTLNLRFDDTVIEYECTGISDSMDGSGGFLPRLDINGSGLVADEHVGTELTIAEYNTFLGGASDGQVLTWVSANSRWEPVDASGGGGAVDSVNGETGVVSLGIQDMNDFALRVANPGTVIYEFNDCSVLDAPASPGQWGLYSEGSQQLWLNTNDSNGQDAYNATLSAITPGDIWWRVDGGAWTATTFSNFTNYSTTYSIILSGPSISDYVSAGAVLEIAFASPDFTPLAEGDVLAWSDVDGKFKPATVPDTKRIQDMNDYGLATTAITSYFYDIHSVNLSNAGFWYTDGTGYIYIYKTDDGLNDITADPGYGQEIVWYSQDQVNWTPTTGGFTEFSSYVRWDINTPAPDPAQNLYVTFTDPGNPEIPLADGDILRWSATDGEFRPTSDYVSLTSLKTEVAASTDFADFQTRIAAL